MLRLCALAGVCLSLAVCTVCRADIYRFVDENGVVHFTNVPVEPGFTPIIKERRTIFCDESAYDGIIKKLCRRYTMDTALIKAVIKAESGFDPNAVSKKGAQGLMQLMPHKARELKVLDPFDPQENLRGGISYLRSLLDMFDGNVRLALAAYNAGENEVKRRRGVPPFEETRTYIHKVMRFKNQYQAKH